MGCPEGQPFSLHMPIPPQVERLGAAEGPNVLILLENRCFTNKKHYTKIMIQHLKLLLISFLLFLLFLPLLYTETPGFPFEEIGRIPVSDDMHFRIETNNDSYSMLSQTGWDDLRTFGMYFGFSWRQWALETTLDALTNRSNTKESSGRLDQTSTAVTTQVYTYNQYPFSLSLSAGGGALFLGNAGLYNIQTAAHSIFAPDLKVPSSYENPVQRHIFLADFLLRGSWETPIMPINLYTSIEIGHTSFFRTENYLEADFSNGYLGMKISSGFQWAANYKEVSPSFTATLSSETGPYFGAIFTAGNLESGFSYNLVTSRQTGYVAISWTDENNSEKMNRLKNNTIQSIEYRMVPLLATVRLKQSISVFPYVISPVLGAESGPFMESYKKMPTNEQNRYEEIYLGIDATKSLVSWCDVYIMAAAGIRKDIITSMDVYATVIYAEKDSAVFFAESGIRLYLPSEVPRPFEWGLGISAGVLYVNAFETGFLPSFQLFLIGTTNRRAKQ